MPFNVAHLDYLQQVGTPIGGVPADGPMTNVPLGLRRLWRVKGIGVTEKEPRRDSEPQLHLPTQDLLIGLYGLKVPVAFVVIGEPGSISIRIGTWMRGGQFDPGADEVKRGLADRHASIKASLQSAFQSIDLVPADTDFPLPTAAGLVMGVPTLKPPDPGDGALPMDRLIRALAGSTWGCLVLAEPVKETAIARLRLGAINEMKSVQAETEARKVPNPLADYYSQLLNVTLTNFTYGLAMGTWRTAVYLMGYENSYNRLAAVWQGVFSGEQSLPAPIRTNRDQAAPSLARDWKVLDAAGRDAPGLFEYPLEFQTLLNSDQLAAYIHLPRLETNGFSVTRAPHFDTVPFVPEEGAKSIRLGTVLHSNRSAQASYLLPYDSMTKHVFVAGVTGAGKTRTILHLLKEASAAEVPFLIIEPAKTEYRELLNHPDVGRKLQVYTLGNENISPFRLNPFEVLEGTPIAVHIDLLRSVFSVSFGLWTPLPQVLEECFQLIYEDKGWDITANENRRTDDVSDPLAFPTLSDLLNKLDEVIPRLGFDPEATGRVRGSLRTRLNSLRSGGKGRMLDVQRSIPMAVLLEHPTVLELEGLGDDDDKAFIMGLLLIRLVEYRRNPKTRHEADGKRLQHLLVFEEAHRLLTNVGAKGEQGEANPRAKAVESFANLLSEIRAHGQGVIVADQVPIKLAPDVIKNTNLKIAHRVVDSEDRKVLAGAMAMTEAQATTLATLLPGRAAVFSEGDDAPLLVHVTEVDKEPKPDALALRAHMAKSEVLVDHREYFRSHEACADTGSRSGAACQAARVVAEEPSFRREFTRLALSLVDDTSALSRLWLLLARHVDASIRAGIDKRVMERCLIARAAEWFAARRGSQAGWSYEKTADLSERLRRALLSNEKGDAGEAIESLRNCLLALHQRELPPYPRCEAICDHAPLCLYRHAVADVIRAGDFTGRWNASDPANIEKSKDAWLVCRSVAESLLEWSNPQRDAIRRVSLCYAQMMVAGNGALMPERQDEVMAALIQEAESERGPG